MSEIKLWRWNDTNTYSETVSSGPDVTAGRWFPEDVAQALLDVAAAMRDTTGRLNVWACLERLDAVRGRRDV